MLVNQARASVYNHNNLKYSLLGSICQRFMLNIVLFRRIDYTEARTPTILYDFWQILNNILNE